jgi:predicted RNA-binding protein with TRAM domain
MLRFLFKTTAGVPLAFAAILALVAPASAQDAEVGQTYEITIATEENNQYTGPYGQVMIGSIFVMVPEAKIGERYSVRVTAIAENQYSGNVQAACEFALIGGTREGMCLPAP